VEQLCCVLLPETVVPEPTSAVGEIERGPVVVFEGPPDLEVVIDRGGMSGVGLLRRSLGRSSKPKSGPYPSLTKQQTRHSAPPVSLVSAVPGEAVHDLLARGDFLLIDPLLVREGREGDGCEERFEPFTAGALSWDGIESMKSSAAISSMASTFLSLRTSWRNWAMTSLGDGTRLLLRVESNV